MIETERQKCGYYSYGRVYEGRFATAIRSVGFRPASAKEWCSENLFWDDGGTRRSEGVTNSRTNVLPPAGFRREPDMGWEFPRDQSTRTVERRVQASEALGANFCAAIDAL